ncbi:serine O-acetyltransferase EpsC [Dietzia sp.]|uniref:serine O-acetyltransferase EpsC n=1 Tax=Dietzia sp. TaxID=1871616 RepID=UPI002FD88562
MTSTEHLPRTSAPQHVAEPCRVDSQAARVWDRLSDDARDASREPLVAGLVLDLIDGCDTFAESLARLAAARIATPEIGRHVLEKEIGRVLKDAPAVMDAVAADLDVSYTRNPAYPNLLVPYLFAKGFLGFQIHRVAHEMWKSGRIMAASFLQSRVSEVFAMDIHPAAVVGSGILADHATGIVIGETARMGDCVSILQGVTLGGTGKEDGDRHPKVGNGVLLSAGSNVIGNISIGDNSKVAAGSVVLHDVPPFATVAGVPAKVVRIAEPDVVPAEAMDQTLEE